jgi:hypothetical protein
MTVTSLGYILYSELASAFEASQIIHLKLAYGDMNACEVLCGRKICTLVRCGHYRLGRSHLHIASDSPITA